jgi:hypothetical protein
VSPEHPLAAALVNALDDAALAQLADRLAPLLEARLAGEADGWMDAKGAARYLGLPSVHALNKLAGSDNPPPFHQDVPAGKRFYRKAELDQWRREQ